MTDRSRNGNFHPDPTIVKKEKDDTSEEEVEILSYSPSSSGNSPRRRMRNHFPMQQYHPYQSARCQKCVYHGNSINLNTKKCTYSESPKLPMNHLKQPSQHERNRHMNSHLKNCSFCGMYFPTRDELLTHVAGVHLSAAIGPELLQSAVPRTERTEAETFVPIPKQASPQCGEPNSVEQGACSCSSSSMKKAVNQNNNFSKTHGTVKQPVSGESSISHERAPKFPRASSFSASSEALIKAIIHAIPVEKNKDPSSRPPVSDNLGSDVPPVTQNVELSILEQILQGFHSKASELLSIVSPLTIDNLNALIHINDTPTANSSTECLDNCDTPSLNFKNYSHLNWLIAFIKEVEAAGYPLKDSTRKKIAHISSNILHELGQPTGILCIKKNFVRVVEAQKQLSDFLYQHFRCVCDILI